MSRPAKQTSHFTWLRDDWEPVSLFRKEAVKALRRAQRNEMRPDDARELRAIAQRRTYCFTEEQRTTLGQLIGFELLSQVQLDVVRTIDPEDVVVLTPGQFHGLQHLVLSGSISGAARSLGIGRPALKERVVKASARLGCDGIVSGVMAALRNRIVESLPKNYLRVPESEDHFAILEGIAAGWSDTDLAAHLGGTRTQLNELVQPLIQETNAKSPAELSVLAHRFLELGVVNR